MRAFYNVGTIGDVCDVGDGAHASIKRVDSGVPYLMSRNLKNGMLDLNKVSYISEADFQKHFKDSGRTVSKVRENDVIFGIIGSLGDAYLVRRLDRFGLSSSVAILRPDTNVLFSQYLFYWVRGRAFQEALYGIKGGVAQGYVSLEMIRSLPLVIPPLNAQKRVSVILASYDALIENNTRRIEILEEMARRLYEEWFVQFRFPGYEGVEFKESELGLIPKGWGVAAVTDVFTIKYGKTFPKTKLNPEGHYPVFGGGGMIGRCDQFNIQGPTTLITSRGNGSGTVWRASETGLVTNNAFIVMPRKSKSNVHYGYIERALLNAPIKSFLGGAAQPQLTLDGLAGVRVLTPDAEVVQQFSALVDPFYALISRIERASANLRAQRDLLLPKLISGEIDVSDIPMPT